MPYTPQTWANGVAGGTPLSAARLTVMENGIAAAQAAAEAAAAGTVTSNTQTASYTLVLGDAGKVIEMNVAGANTLTVPPNSSVAFPVGTVIEVYQMGAGQVTLTPGSGVTIRGPSMTTRAQYSTVSLRKRATDEWVASGDLT